MNLIKYTISATQFSIGQIVCLGHNWNGEMIFGWLPPLCGCLFVQTKASVNSYSTSIKLKNKVSEYLKATYSYLIIYCMYSYEKGVLKNLDNW